MEHTEKRCGKCHAVKTSTLFYRDKSLKDGLTYLCKACFNSAAKRRRMDNPEVYRHANLLQRYGITAVEYDTMLAAQHGVCAICYRTNSNGKPLFVDHCHATGSVRKLLCQTCNTMLGMADDVPDRLRAAAAYLELHRS